MANQQAFVDQYGDLADHIGGQLGVDPSILLGQWGLETGWGKSVVPGTNNLGNIKGPGVAATDNQTGSNDQYRAYDTPDAFGQDFAGLINRRYAGAANSGADAKRYASALASGGYAEDPNYADKLVSAADTVRGLTGVRGALNSAASAIFPSADAAASDDIFSGAKTAAPKAAPVGGSDDIFAGAATAAPKAAQQSNGSATTSYGPDGSLSVTISPTGGSMGAPANANAKAITPGAASPIAVQPAAAADPTAPPRTFMEDLGRQFGLTARYGLEGVGQAAQMFTEPARRFVVNPIADLAGLPHAESTGQTMSSAADALGLPQPENKQERVVGDVARLMAGTGTMAGGAGALSSLGRSAGGLLPNAGAPITAGSIAGQMAAKPVTQLGAAVGSGAAGGLAKENGSGAGGQFVASLGGGLLGGGLASLTGNLVDTARNAFGRATMSPAALDIRFNNVLQDAGVKPANLPPSVARQLRAELETSLRTGREIRPDAVRRLADFRTVGATPTRGTITLDPVQITREKNLAKIAANSSDDTLAALPRIQNENNGRLIQTLNDAGAANAPDAITAGETVMGSIYRNLDRQKADISNLYSQARDSAGRSFPLDGAAFTNRAAQLLDDNLLGHALPESVRAKLNQISQGQVPFTVDFAEQLKTVMGNLQRSSSDGSTRKALSFVRQALDEAPVLGLGEQTRAAGARAVNPGNLPALPNAPQLGEDAIAAFNQARAAHRTMMGEIEATPALKGVHENSATPDEFMQKFVIGKSASVEDVANLRRNLGLDATAVNAVRGNILDWLKGRALNGAADEVGNFSQSAFNKALKAIGDRKLEQFFNAQEIGSLKSLGRVASYLQHQPVGSAVNNSNSGALLAGRGYDLLRSVVNKIPFGEAALLSPLRNIEVSVRQRAAQNLQPGLLAGAAKSAPGSGLLAPGAAAVGGLLAPPVVYGSQDRQRR